MSSKSITTINPATGKVIKQHTPDTSTKVEAKIKRAHSFQKEWKQYTFKERAAVIKKVADQLLQDKNELALLATREMGKPLSQSIAEVEKCADTMKYYAQTAAVYLKDEIIKTGAAKSFVTFQPLGVVLAIMPWNFPYWQLYRCAAPILMAGNTMILKHASNVSGCALAIEASFKKAGAPAGLLQTILYPAQEMDAVIQHPQIAAVTFTGSTQAGKHIASVAAGALKKQVLELGGSDAYVILKDADMAHAVKTCVAARLINSGQSCVSAKRFIVVKEVYDQFVAQYKHLMSEATYGNSEEGNYSIGPLARTDLRDQLHEQVLQSIGKGAKLLLGGFIPKEKGSFYPPTLLVNVKKGMPAYDEEMFGPVAAIIKANDEQDAFNKANDSEYGLGGAIFSKNIKRAEHLAATQMDTGNCYINTNVFSHKMLPFGGVKHSGYGRELGSFGIREFVNAKTVLRK